MMNRLHPELRHHLPALMEIITYARDTKAEPEELAGQITQIPEWLDAYEWAMGYLTNNRITAFGGCAYGLPLLDAAYCAELVAESERLGAERGYVANPEEDSPYQIPEIVLSHTAPELYREVQELLLPALNTWFTLIYQVVPERIASIQFAKYEPNGTAHGNWHHDKDSPFTAVVSLAPELFTGGGTDIRTTPTSFVSIDPLPAGFALVMNGQQIMHRGRAVESGVRHLLVLWLAAGESVAISQTPSDTI